MNLKVGFFISIIRYTFRYIHLITEEFKFRSMFMIYEKRLVVFVFNTCQRKI